MKYVYLLGMLITTTTFFYLYTSGN